MGDWPGSIMGGNKIEISYNSWQSGAANVKGAWGSIISATPYDGVLCGTISPFTVGSYLADIGVGSSGAEVTVLGNLLYSNAHENSQNNMFMSPLLIKRGSRVAVRIQSTSGSAWTDISLTVLPCGFMSDMQLCTTLGANTADSGGTSIDPGPSAGTKGSWVQFSASLPHDVRAIMLAFGNQTNNDRRYSYWKIDVGITSTPDSNIILSDFVARTYSFDDTIYPFFSPPLPVSIARGSQLHVRASCDITDPADRLLDVALYAFV